MSRHLRRRDERGLSNSVQAALLFPLLVLPLLLGLQWGLQAWAHATALAAAQDGARTAAALGGSVREAERVTRDALAGGAFTSSTVHVARGVRDTTATVTGKALSVVPLWNADIRVTATAPTQRITNS